MGVTNKLSINKPKNELKLKKTVLVIEKCVPDDTKGYLEPKKNDSNELEVTGIDQRFVDENYLWYKNGEIGYKVIGIKNNVIWMIELDSSWRGENEFIIPGTNQPKNVEATGHVGWIDLNGDVIKIGWIILCGDYGYEIKEEDLPHSVKDLSPLNHNNTTKPHGLKPITEEDSIGYALFQHYTGVVKTHVSIDAFKDLAAGLKSYNAVLGGMAPTSESDREAILYVGTREINEDGVDISSKNDLDVRLYIEGYGLYFNADDDFRFTNTEDYGNYSYASSSADNRVIYLFEKYGVNVDPFEKTTYTKDGTTAPTLVANSHLQMILRQEDGSNILAYFYTSNDFVENVDASDLPVTAAGAAAMIDGSFESQIIRFKETSDKPANIIMGAQSKGNITVTTTELENLSGLENNVGNSNKFRLDEELLRKATISGIARALR